MAETSTTRYRRLFEIRLLHHYWLDDGATVFDRIADQGKKDARLLNYDMRHFLSLRPTPSSEKRLGSLQCSFRETALGCVVGAPDVATIPAETMFEFVVTVTDPKFYDYTALTLRPQRIYELPLTVGEVTSCDRYKENVPVLSNLTGATRGADLFLSREIPTTAAYSIEALVASGGALVQLTSDGPAPTIQNIGAPVTDFPVYLHQGDVPAIVPTPGRNGAPARGVHLSNDVPDAAFALLQLIAVRGDAAFSFVDANGAAKPVAPIYQVRFRNRSTVWRYLDKQTKTTVSTEPAPLPLTYFGNAGSGRKPSDGFVAAENSGAKITRLISEIYV